MYTLVRLGIGTCMTIVFKAHASLASQKKIQVVENSQQKKSNLQLLPGIQFCVTCYPSTTAHYRTILCSNYRTITTTCTCTFQTHFTLAINLMSRIKSPYQRKQSFLVSLFYLEGFLYTPFCGEATSQMSWPTQPESLTSAVITMVYKGSKVNA